MRGRRGTFSKAPRLHRETLFTKKMKSIIFVCHGNICRSPMAEYVMKKLLDEAGIAGVRVISRALHTDALGCNIYSPARRTLDKHGVPHERRQAKMLTKEEYDGADLVAVMDSENYHDAVRRFGGEKVKKLLSFAGDSSDVADPWYTDDFERTYRDIDKGCRALVRLIAARS